MADPVLELAGVGKAYRRYRSELHRIRGWFGARIAPLEEHWAVREVDLAIAAGQAVGIVGRNGAGKSTLLKIVAGTVRPTTGTLTVRGRVAAILELGMGFNPELTGPQNVYQAAGMMGFTPPEIAGVMDEIRDFAELGDYFDQPIRVYSSGMHVRLAFAVATAFRPDVLIIDEALAVGDAYFQHKSFSRLRAYREQGTTLILVSHDKATVQSICERAVLLEEGRIVKDGDPESVLDYYNALTARGAPDSIETVPLPSGRIQTISGNRKARIVSAALHDAQGAPLSTVPVGAPVELRVTVRAEAALPRLVLGYALKDRLGQTLYGTNTHYTGQALTEVAAGETVTFSIGFAMELGPGNYSVALSLSPSESHLTDNYEWRDLAVLFEVVNLGAPFDGKLRLTSAITVSRHASAASEDGRRPA